jgi:hypothetical protein
MMEDSYEDEDMMEDSYEDEHMMEDSYEEGWTYDGGFTYEDAHMI